MLFSRSGGFLSTGDLHAWLSMGRGDWAEPAPGSGIYHLRGLAPGGYGVAWSAQTEWALAAPACTVGPPGDVEWVEVAPGGTASLEVDVRAQQAAAGPGPPGP